MLKTIHSTSKDYDSRPSLCSEFCNSSSTKHGTNYYSAPKSLGMYELLNTRVTWYILSVGVLKCLKLLNNKNAQYQGNRAYIR